MPPRNREGDDADRGGRDKPRHHAGHEQVLDRLLRHFGIDHEGHARWNQDPERAAGRHQPGRERARIAERSHLRNHHAPERGCRSHGRSGHGAENGRRAARADGCATGDAADQRLHEIEEIFRKARPQHDVAGEDEERNRQQHEAVEPGIKRLRNLRQRRELEDEDRRESGQPKRKADRHAEGKQEQQGDNQDDRHRHASTLATAFSGRMPARRRMSRRLIVAKPIGMVDCATQIGNGRSECANEMPNSADSCT